MIVYLDTSLLMQEIFKQGKYLSLFESINQAYSSELLIIEAMRTIDRYRIEGKLRDDELARAKHYLLEYKKSINLVEMSTEIKKRAAMPFSTIVGTLDAIHLCTALYLRNEMKTDLTMATLDKQLATASMAEGVPLAIEL